MSTTFIYALCEPGTRTVRYIGKTNDLKDRLRRHLSVSVKLNTHLGHWLKQLTSAPNLVLLKEVQMSEWKTEEARYIRSSKVLGLALVNATAGGEGCQDPSEDTLKKMRASATGRLMSYEAKKRMSEISKARRGRTHSLAARHNISEAIKKHWELRKSRRTS